MSNKQRSFFDQVPKPAANRRWQRHTSTGNLPSHSNAVPSLKHSTTAPPISASTQSRSKLKAFMFEDSHGSVTKPNAAHQFEVQDKENLHSWNPDGHVEDSTHVQSVPVEGPKTGKECPQTPGPRLLLAGLLGNNEDATLSSSQAKDSTPHERVYWDHSRRSPKSSNLGSSFDTPLPKIREEGRTRTPSPISSSRPDKKIKAANRRESLDLQTLQDSLKTPQADPATELWNRYTVKTGMKNSPSASPVPPFAHLIEASSPHCGSALPRGLLRRSLSCHNEWPTSASKRRRIKGPQEEKDNNDVFASGSPGKERSKLSRVSMLMDRIQESFTKEGMTGDPAEPSSSSPLPDRSDSLFVPPPSPLQRRAQTTGADSSKSAAALYQREEIAMKSLARDETEMNPNRYAKHHPKALASDAGGEAINENNANVNVSVMSAAQSAPNEDYGEDIMEALVESDDFGSDEDDLFTADLEHMAARYDQSEEFLSDPPVHTLDTLPQPATETGTNPAKSISQKGSTHAIIDHSSDDEFGEDDIELEQFVAAEVAATQASRPSSNHQNFVRLHVHPQL
ncbi:hypothetical protein L228DRAFT_54207 [Xylona heveae TC161]|uniref:Uncharacterized protein n=1 Tax=Xylona heveae (strain CBS 132557 / TC161) TaxID=1328760 RepID=A0A164Z969_XYLHT|nr:hypothetical protein L228DRAFT_54207 [Xylona heveae TC161]KZF18835.1 hypothetical protein L228DRAFT_54207 [Xylona heveae TC161]